MKKSYLLLLSFIALLAFANCNKDTNEPDPVEPSPEQIIIAEEYALGAGLKVVYYAYEELFVGYNKVYFTVLDSITNEVVSGDLEISMMPMMDMGMMMHSSPTEPLEFNSNSKQYVGAVVYVMPSLAGDWTLTVTLNNETGDTGVAVFELMVTQPEEAKLVSFVSNLDTNATYFISLIQPANPKVGENDFEILINRKASMIDWPYEPYLTVEFEPYMPAMNHGSPNNVNPSHIGAGHYKGKVNFTMTGWWQLNMVIKDGEGSILNDDSYFDVTFQ